MSGSDRSPSKASAAPDDDLAGAPRRGRVSQGALQVFAVLALIAAGAVAVAERAAPPGGPTASAQESAVQESAVLASAKAEPRLPAPAALGPRTPLAPPPAAAPAQPAKAPAAPAKSRPFSFAYEDILDALTGQALRLADKRVRIAGLSGPGRDEVCFDGTTLWACGLQARAALMGLIRKQTVQCAAGSLARDGAIEAACSVNGEDIGLALRRQGWARLARETSPDATEEEAKAAGRGLWRGGWHIRTAAAP